MSDRIIDPTRYGITHEPGTPGAESDIIGQAKPLTLEEACAIVDSWPPDFAPFRLHQVARALRREIARLTAEASDGG